MSGSRISVSARGPALVSTSPNSRCSWLVCQASSSSTRASRSMPSLSAVSHSRSGLAPVSESTTCCSRSTYSASWPASSTRLLLTSSSGSVVSIQACESSDIATPASTRSMPKRQVFWTKSTPYGLRCSRSKPQRMLACRTQRVMSSRSSSVNPNRARTGAACARLSTSLDGGPAAGQREQLRRDAEQRVGLDERAVGEPHPQPVRGVHARDHVAEPEARDDQRRVGLDVRAHDEDVARFERVVVGEQAEQNLAENVDLAGRAVAAVHLHRAVVGRSVRPSRPHGVGGDVGLQPAQQRVGAVVAPADQEVFVGLRVRRQAALQFAEVAAEGGQQRMADLAVAGVVAAGDRAVHVGERSATGRRWGAAATGEGRGGWPARRAVRSRCWAAGCGRTATAAPAGRSVTPAVVQAFSRAGCAVGRRRRGRAARATGAAASRGRQRYRRRYRFPSRRAAAAAGGHRRRTVRRAGARRRSAGPAGAPSPRRPRSGRGGWPASCTSRRRSCRR